ncbi:hypothetical protein F3Y22_tig00110280pilonHSYRG00044 [Hibiscus syriacus]|uniref:DUF3741 domain-containing protein n=1 Tax=Hibiscus syriacus TaxID=106335 RepID=A0A6A3B7A8_HIBSY|nr:hypothetical protein F3Y22_tig00110280pilonHSYRG00044 [Hibiscus syriacus]
MSNSKRSSSGRFSVVFRRFLCSGTPQTHSSGMIMESTAVNNRAEVRVQTSESGPRIVTRLMGLDSLPEKNWVSDGKTPGQVTWSSSTIRVVMDEDKKIGFEPRKLKSQRGDGSSSKQKENLKDHQEKNRKISKLKNEPMRIYGKKFLKSSKYIGVTNNVQINRRAKSRVKTPLIEVPVETKNKNKNQCEVKKVEYSENSSEGSRSSPISILNVNDFAAHQENCISEDSKALEVKLERNVFHMELVGRPCKLTDEDIKFSNWITKKVFTFQDFEDICMEFEDQILGSHVAPSSR